MMNLDLDIEYTTIPKDYRDSMEAVYGKDYGFPDTDDEVRGMQDWVKYYWLNGSAMPSIEELRKYLRMEFSKTQSFKSKADFQEKFEKFVEEVVAVSGK